MPVVKDRPSDKIIFNHRPKDVVILTNLCFPLQQPTHVEKYVSKVGDSYQREVGGLVLMKRVRITNGQHVEPRTR